MFATCKIARFGLFPLLLAGMAFLPTHGQIRSGVSMSQPPNGAATKPTKKPLGTKIAVTTTPGALIGPPIDLMQPPPTPAPQTPAQAPPAPPRIAYQNGLLTVDSSNARLGDILNAIRTQTGVQFEGLQSANDRVAFRMGPAPVDEVLTELLRGSRFDYMILGSPENAGIVQRVVLTPRAGGSTVAAGAQQPPAQQRPPSGDEEEGGEDQGTAEGASTEQAPPRVVQPPAPQQITPNANGPKTTQQLLDELKQMQQQQQNQNPQMQNQQNPQMPNQQNPPAPIKPPLRPSVPQ